MAGKIFVNYRRDDSASQALNVAQYLEREFGGSNVFLDIDRMRAGQKFPKVLEERLSVSKVMLVIIGPAWLTVTNDAGQRRLDDPEDWVRLEIGSALARGIAIIPVLVSGASLPKRADLPDDLKPLVEHHVATVTTNGFRNEMAGLARDIRELLGGRRRWPLAAAAAGVVVAAGLAMYAGLIPLSGLASLTGSDPAHRTPEQTATAKRAGSDPSSESATAANTIEDNRKIAAAAAEKERQRLATLAADEERKRQTDEAAERQRIAAAKAEAEAAAKADENRKQAEAAAKEKTEREAADKAAKEKAERDAANAEKQRVAMLAAEDEKKRAEAAEAARKAAAVPEIGKSFRDCPECPEMVVVPAGEFTMGSPESEESREKDEGPQRTVKIAKPFGVGKYEVTFTEWDACVSAGSCKQKPETDWGRGRQPVMRVSWDEITREYLPWLSKKSGKTYRLLTEAEWEYAARAGTTTPFSTGKTITPDQANFNGNYTYGGSANGQYRQKTVEAGSFKPNAFGLYDMHGNVWEWVEDCNKDSYQGTATDGSAVTSGDCGRRVLRGGSWSYYPRVLRSAVRFEGPTGGRNIAVGFRVGRTLTP